MIKLEVSPPVLIKQTMADYHEYPIVGRDSNGDI
jgi:hypothetical protein